MSIEQQAFESIVVVEGSAGYLKTHSTQAIAKFCHQNKLYWCAKNVSSNN